MVPAFFLFGVLVHALLARFAITPFNSLLVTFGLTVMIESGIQWKWSADYRRLESAYGGIKFKIGELFVPLTDLVTLGLAVGLAFGIWAALRYTDLGRALRASAEDPQMAAAFGMNQRRLSLVLSGVSAALAGVAGLCIALSFTLAPAQIYAWIGVVFAVVMIGGLGNPLGPLVAGILADGQLDECDLSVSELARVSASFVATLEELYRARPASQPSSPLKLVAS